MPLYVGLEPSDQTGHRYPVRLLKNTSSELNALASAPNTARTALAALTGWLIK
jgi:hypothetical protein